MRYALLLLLVPSLAAAEAAPKFELIDRGDAVEIIARNVKAAKTGITPVRSRLEVPLIGKPRAEPNRPVDPTVKAIELDGGESRVLSVKLNFERADVKALSRYAQALQVGDDLHLIVPRAVPDGNKPVALPEPTLTPALEAKLAAAAAITPEPVMPPPAGPPAPAPVDAAPNAEDAAAARQAAIEEAKAAIAKTDPSKTAGAAKTDKTDTKPAAAAKPATIGKQTAPDPWSNITMYAAVGLALAGCGVWMLRRRKATQPATTSIEVIAQKSLGGKAKIVLLSAGDREMVVAVSGQNVRMLSQWRKPTELGIPAIDDGPELPNLDEITGSFGAFGTEPAPRRASTRSEQDDDAPAPRARANTSLEAFGRPRTQAERPRTNLEAFGRPRTQADTLVRAATSRPVRAETSPAVAGIMRLRAKTVQPTPEVAEAMTSALVNEDVATGDPDADTMWAKEILAATARTRTRRPLGTGAEDPR